MIIDFNNSYQLFNNKIYDRGVNIKKLMKLVVKRLNISTFSQTQSSIEGSKPYSVIIRGERGSGKSIFARNILINFK
jgi:transcriptional regulator with PAS, ATPase and Fis domain